MDVGMWKVLLAISAITCNLIAIRGQPSLNEHAEMKELITLLRQSREQNRRLEKQMTRLKLVWAGLDAMCDVISSASASEGDSMITSTKEASLKETAPLRVLTASSSGNKTGEVTLTVTYTAPRVHTPDWFVFYSTYLLNNMIRTGGITSSLGDGKYTSSIAVPFIYIPDTVTMYVYSEFEIVVIQFNVDALVNKTEEPAPEYTSPILDMFVPYQDDVDRQVLDQAQIAPTKGDLTITLVMNGTSHELDHIFFGVALSFTGLKTVGGETEYYERYTSDTIGMTGRSRSNKTSEVVLSVKEPYVQGGGILSVFVPALHDRNLVLKDGIFKGIHIGHNITILPADSDELIPTNTLGLRHWLNTTTVAATANHSLMCAAMGNPQPKLQIFREFADDRRKKVAIESMDFDRHMSIVYHTFDASNTKAQGKYICRAESGSVVREERTEVVVYYAVIFDATKTGIIKNNTKKVVYGCKARGKQRPELQLRLYDENGPNLADFDTLKVEDSKIGKSVRRLTMTISPPDYDIHTVYCVSRVQGTEQYEKLELFPGVYRENNWELYNGNNNTDVFNATNILIIG